MARPPNQSGFFSEPETKPKKRTAHTPRKARVDKAKPEVEAEQAPAASQTSAAEPLALAPPVFTERPKARDWAMEEAIRTLEPLLSPESRAENADVLDPYFNNPALKERVTHWREAHDY